MCYLRPFQEQAYEISLGPMPIPTLGIKCQRESAQKICAISHQYILWHPSEINPPQTNVYIFIRTMLVCLNFCPCFVKRDDNDKGHALNQGIKSYLLYVD